MNIFESILQEEKCIKFQEIVKDILDRFCYINKEFKNEYRSIKNSDFIYDHNLIESIKTELYQYYSSKFFICYRYINMDCIEVSISISLTYELKSVLELDSIHFIYFLNSKSINIKELSFKKKEGRIGHYSDISYMFINNFNMNFKEIAPRLEIHFYKYYCTLWLQKEEVDFSIYNNDKCDKEINESSDIESKHIILKKNKEIDKFLDSNIKILETVFKKALLGVNFDIEEKELFLLDTDFDLDKNKIYELFFLNFDIENSRFFAPCEVKDKKINSFLERVFYYNKFINFLKRRLKNEHI